MKKTLLSLLTVMSVSVYAQNGQIQNGGFENWTTLPIGTFIDGWTTSEMEFPGAQTVTQSTDAIDQTYSMKLETKLIGTDTAFAYALYGSAGDSGPTFGYSYSTDVDSVTMYMKFDIQPNDSALILVMRRNPIVPMQVDFFYVKGVQSSWKRFTFPLSSMTGAPDSLMVGIASTNAFVMQGVPGSYVYVDNVRMISNSTTAPDLYNYSFEVWNTPTYENPDSWYTFDGLLAARGLPMTTQKSTDASSGSFSIRLNPVLNGNDTIQGIVSVSPFNPAISNFEGLPYTAQPAALEGKYKFAPSGADQISILVQLQNSGSIIDYQVFGTNTAAASFTTFTIPLNVTTQPDTLFLIGWSPNNPGSYVWLDDLQFTGGNVGVLQLGDIASGFYVFPNPTADIVNVVLPKVQGEIALYDMNGRIIFNATTLDMGLQRAISLQDYPAGVYLLRWTDGTNVMTREILKQ